MITQVTEKVVVYTDTHVNGFQIPNFYYFKFINNNFNQN